MYHDDTLPFIESLTAGIAKAVGNSPHVLSEPDRFKGPYRPDAIMGLEHEGHSYRLVIKTRQMVYPRDAREAAWQLKTILAKVDAGDRTTIPLLAADTISTGARQFLRDARVGYFDTSGSLFLPTTGLYVLIDRPASQKQTRSLNNLFSGRRAQVLHSVWALGREWFGVRQIAERAGVSPATASETLSDMERREWVEVRGAGSTKERRLTDPAALLKAWSDYQGSAKAKPMRQFYVSATTPDDLQRRIDQLCEQHGLAYEFAGLIAGQRHAPFLSNVSIVTCRIQSRHALKDLLKNLKARSVRAGWNLGLIEVSSDDDLRFRQRLNDLWFADPLQAYLDLLQAGGRAKDLAQHLRNERLIPMMT